MAPRTRRESHAALPELLRAATRVRKNAHAPYSNFAVGAAVLAGGRVFAGVNVENSSFPLGSCAERSAVCAAVSAGERRIDAVVVVGGHVRPVPPCGGCRQVLSEFCGPATPVVYATPEGVQVETTMVELLPSAFGAVDLRPAEPAPRRAAGRPLRR
jgi:cytidine deaminase